MQSYFVPAAAEKKMFAHFVKYSQHTPSHHTSVRPHPALPPLFILSPTPPLPPVLAESGHRLSCVATATAASSSTCCPPLLFIPPSFSPPSPPSPPSPLPPPPLPLSVALMALCQPLFTSEETPSSGGKRRAVTPDNAPVCLCVLSWVWPPSQSFSVLVLLRGTGLCCYLCLNFGIQTALLIQRVPGKQSEENKRLVSLFLSHIHSLALSISGSRRLSIRHCFN